MPKTTDTRKQRAKELLERLERGPADFVEHIYDEGNEHDVAAKKAYQLWVHSWIINEVKDLIPELRVKK